MTLAKKTLNKPDETRQFQGKGNMAVVTMGDATVGRGTFEPGWKWSTNVKPIAGTDSCQANHTAYVLSGRMIVKSDNGTQVEYGPGDVMIATAGHDGWAVGSEPSVLIDWTGVKAYAKKA
ncbi:MAG: cupin domain-containing protein [Chloroflexota bacterium]|nr:cupin domain-containing protein [Chloroflexota bacterium]